MPSSVPPISLQGISFAELEKMLAQRRLPPVDKWNPPHCGHSGMRIDRNGVWFHEERPIRRPAMVRLFSTVLRREPDGSHALVTPVEKLTIDVETTAFRAVEMRMEGEGEQRRIALQLDTGEGLIVGRDHALYLAEGKHGPRPRVSVRNGLEAELARPIYYELADIALKEGHDPAGIWSAGCFFALTPAQ